MLTMLVARNQCLPSGNACDIGIHFPRAVRGALPKIRRQFDIVEGQKDIGQELRKLFASLFYHVIRCSS